MAGMMDGRVALVTGAGSGIGRQSAILFAQNGAKVLVADIVEPGGIETVEMIKKNGGDAVFFKVDVSKPDQVQAMVNQAIKSFGRLDYAHNNAGVEGQMTSLVDYPVEDFDRVLGINLKGVFLGMKYEIPVMVKQGKGAIVNTASVAGLIGFPNTAAYTSSKHGVAGLTKVASIEYSKLGVRVNAVCPGVILTPMITRATQGSKEAEAAYASVHPIGRLGQPEEIAAAVVWLCSDAASFVTGVAFPVDGGFVSV